METDIERNHNHHFNPNHTISVNTFNEYVKDILEKHIKRKYKAHIRSEHTKHVTTLQESITSIIYYTFSAKQQRANVPFI